MMHDFPEKDTIEFYIHGLSVKHGGRTAFLWKGSYRTRRLTYASVYDYARRAAALLESMGIEKGDRICLLADSSPSWAILFFGCLLKGVVVVPIDVRSDDAFVQTVIGRVSAKAVFCPARETLTPLSPSSAPRSYSNGSKSSGLWTRRSSPT